MTAWSDPQSWPDNRVPGPTDVARVTAGRTVEIDRNVSVAGAVVEAGATLAFQPGRSAVLLSAGNIVVEGVLQARPALADILHRVEFSGAEEPRYVGGGHAVLDTDVGLWVHGGRLDLRGTPKTSWTRATTGLMVGATSIGVASTSGWRVGDQLVVTPTARPSVAGWWDKYSYRRIASINGNTITLDGPLQNGHPATIDQEGRLRVAEVLNLTRNVVVTGRPGGRAHIMITHGNALPQVIDYTEIAWMGPRQANSEGYTSSVLGRYPLHFHECGDASGGSMVAGTVVHDSGGHAFVPHASHGINFLDCVAHNIYEDAYWWDLAPSTREPGPASHFTRWERCVASRVLWDPEFRGYGLAGFQLPRGNGNVCTQCVAVGVQGNVNAAGFSWPEEMIDEQGVWEFTFCVAHNCKVNGIFTWQNGPQVHPVGRTAIWHCERGIEHGAYVNSYVYDNFLIWACRVGIHAHAHTHGPGRLEFRRINIHLDGLGPEAVQMRSHHQAGAEMAFINNQYRGYTAQAIHGGREGMRNRTRALFQDTVWDSATLPHYVRGQALAGTIVREVEGGRQVMEYRF
jgi:hypothetical protein